MTSTNCPNTACPRDTAICPVFANRWPLPSRGSIKFQGRMAGSQHNRAVGAGGGKNAVNLAGSDGDKSVDYGRIKLPAAGLSQAAHSLFLRESVSIRPVGNHRVKRLDNGDNARTDGNLPRVQLAGISIAVEAFVMMQREQADRKS